MKKKVSLLILLATIKLTLFGQVEQESYITIHNIDSTHFDLVDFKSIPKEYVLGDRAFLIDKIRPAKQYAYWECIYKDALSDESRGQLIVYNGDSINFSAHAKEIYSDKGFFLECHPGICFTYIVGINSDRTIDLIDSNEKLRSFIGDIENVEEAILVAKLNDFWFDTDTLIGGAYKERANDYLMFLLDYSSEPVTYKSVRAVLTKKGVFNVLDKTIYKQTNEYIIE